MTTMTGQNTPINDGDQMSSYRTESPPDDQFLEEIRSKELGNILSRIVKNFSIVWFTVSMDTGVLSIILHQFPYPSHWARVCATIMFTLNVVLFLLFTTIYILHWTLYYKSTSKTTRADAEEIALQACPAIAWMLITVDIQLICAQSWGYGFTILAWVMWWIGLVWVLSTCVVLYLHLIRFPSSRIVDKGLPTAVFIPIVGVFTASNLASILITGAKGETHIPDRLAVPTIVIGFVLVGFGLGLAVVMYAIYMHRLMTSGYPEALKIPGILLTVGPCGQSATALLGLGSAAFTNDNFGRYAKGFFLTDEAATIVRILCVVLALFLLGFALFWMTVDYYAILDGLVHRTIHPSLFWWSSIFPVGTVSTALTNLGNDMDSPAFKILAVILFVFLFCVYVFNACFTIPMTLSGRFLGIPSRKF